MKAVIIREYGNEDVLKLEEVEKPSTKPDDILVKIQNIGLNPVEWKVRNGLGEIFGMKLPIFLGSEISGTVEAVGADVNKFKVGDEIFGNVNMMRGGGYADYVLAKESEIAHKPQNIDFVQAAAIPVGALTSWQGIFTTGNLQSGQTVLIHGAAGGVGSMGVQLAKAKGAYVYATGSGKNEDFIKELGADEFINYTTTKFEEVAQDVDVVLDTVGGDTQTRSFQVLKKGGFLVSLVAPPSQELAEQYGVKAEMIQSGPNGELLEAIAKFVEEGKVRAHIEKIFPLSEIKEAHKLSESGRTRGKIVLES
ncbi:MAG TPA: NADP-dependent oxidoreductase [Pyrinomonadaceae bacterium]|nr:NADP-dependent oxidoreductase [Pyrinomonadaceae bacterium]